MTHQILPYAWPPMAGTPLEEAYRGLQANMQFAVEQVSKDLAAWGALVERVERLEARVDNLAELVESLAGQTQSTPEGWATYSEDF